MKLISTSTALLLAAGLLLSQPSHAMMSFRQIGVEHSVNQLAKVAAVFAAGIGAVFFDITTAAIIRAGALNRFMTTQVCKSPSQALCEQTLPELNATFAKLDASDLEALNTMLNYTRGRSMLDYRDVFANECSGGALPKWCYELDSSTSARVNFWVPLGAATVGAVIGAPIGFFAFRRYLASRTDILDNLQ